MTSIILFILILFKILLKKLDENPEFGDLKILVDISDKWLYLINGNKIINKYLVVSSTISC